MKLHLLLIALICPTIAFASPIYDYKFRGKITNYSGLKEDAEIRLRVEQDPRYSDYGWITYTSLNYRETHWIWSDTRPFLGSVDYETEHEGIGIPTHFMALSALSFSNGDDTLRFAFDVWTFYNIPFEYNIIGNLEHSTPPWGRLHTNGEETAIVNWRIAKVPEPATLSLLALGLAALGIRRKRR